jgi:O-antigen ligase
LERTALIAMAAALACEPLYIVRPRLGPLPTTLLEILLIIAILLGVVALGLCRLPWRNPYTWPALLFLAGATLNVFFAPSLRAAAGIWKAYFVEPALAALVIAGLAAAGLIVAMPNLALAGFHAARHTFSLVTPPVTIYTTANAVALFLVPLDALALAILLFADDRRERLAAAAFLAVTGAAVLASFSRAGWLALAAAGLLVAAFHRRRWLLIGPGLAVALAAGLGIPAVRARIAVEFDPSSPNNSVISRLSLWESTLNLLRARPLTGGGLAGFLRSLEPYRTAGYGEKLLYPHDIVLNFWTETGLIGLAGFVWLSLQAVRTGRDALAAPGLARVLAIGWLAALLAVWLHGLVDAPYFKNDLSVEFWALLGLQLAAWRAPSRTPAPTPAPNETS